MCAEWGLAMLLLTIVVVSVTILYWLARAAADSITRASKTTAKTARVPA